MSNRLAPAVQAAVVILLVCLTGCCVHHKIAPTFRVVWTSEYTQLNGHGICTDWASAESSAEFGNKTWPGIKHSVEPCKKGKK